MKIDLSIQGRGEFLRLQVDGARLSQEIRDDVRDLANAYRQRVLADLRSTKSGRQYGVTKGRAVYRRRTRMATVFGGMRRKVTSVELVRRNVRAYRASAPGEAPASFTGTLARSVRAKISPPSKGTGATVYADRRTAFYRHFLEFGTSTRTSTRRKNGKGGNRGRVLPRPVWTPLQAKLTEDLFKRVSGAADRFAAGGTP